MTDEAAKQPEEDAQLPKELDIEQSFNLLVNLARQSKLTYDEHALVDKAVHSLSNALNLQN